MDQVPGVLHPLVAVPSDGLELLLGQRLRGLHVRPRRHLLPLQPLEEVGVGVGGEDHLLGRDRAAGRDQLEAAVPLHLRHR